MSGVTRAEFCAVACADAWRGDGEIVASPIGLMPTIGARLARATFSPDLLLTDGEAAFVAGTWAVDKPAPAVVESWIPYRAVFDVAWAGKRHVMMGPSQIDRYGNANISCIGDFAKPTVQLLGVRGAPGNTVHHPTSYWIPKHSTRTFVPQVDMVCGVGYDSAAEAGTSASRFLELRRVVTNLGVFDFGGPGHAMRLVCVHPGVTVNEVLARTGFELALADVAETRQPEADELRLIREIIDPRNLRDWEIPS